MNTAVHFSSATDLWSTPQDFYDKLDAEFHFTLDPCATHDNHKTDKYFTIDDDGLKQDWSHDIVFMNPPYGRVIGDWMKKAAESNTTVVCLVPARTDTKWWHDYVIEHNAEIRFIKGRLKFGGQKNSAPFPSAVVIFRKVDE
jgi:site-specific DNA-methyltransferase (adenine-specific)